MDAFAQALSLGGAILGSMLIGMAKKPIANMNVTLRNAIKPVQPLVLLGLSVALPLLGAKIGITDMGAPEVWANAPLSTLLAISGREVLKKLKKPAL